MRTKEGLYPWYCRTHGWVLDAPLSATVWCRCGARAALDETDRGVLKRVKAHLKSRRKSPGQRAAKSQDSTLSSSKSVLGQ